MNLQKRLILNFKITYWVKKREKLRSIAPWQKVDLKMMDNVIKKLENQLKDGVNA